MLLPCDLLPRSGKHIATRKGLCSSHRILTAQIKKKHTRSIFTDVSSQEVLVKADNIYKVQLFYRFKTVLASEHSSDLAKGLQGTYNTEFVKTTTYS